MSELHRNLENKSANHEMIEKLCPEDIFPPFRKTVFSLLEGERCNVVTHPAVAETIVKWNKKLLACESASNRADILSAANDDIYEKAA